MNTKRFLWAFIALFIFTFFYQWFVNAFLLSGLYKETADLWRSHLEMKRRFPLMILYHAAVAIWLTFAYFRFYGKGGIKDGFNFGLIFGVFAAILAAAPYIWLPITAGLAVSWFIAFVIQGIISGLILGALYSPKPVR